MRPPAARPPPPSAARPPPPSAARPPPPPAARPPPPAAARPPFGQGFQPGGPQYFGGPPSPIQVPSNSPTPPPRILARPSQEPGARTERGREFTPIPEDLRRLADAQERNYFAQQYGSRAPTPEQAEGECTSCHRHSAIDIASGMCDHCVLERVAGDDDCDDDDCPRRPPRPASPPRPVGKTTTGQSPGTSPLRGMREPNAEPRLRTMLRPLLRRVKAKRAQELSANKHTCPSLEQS